MAIKKTASRKSPGAAGAAAIWRALSGPRICGGALAIRRGAEPDNLDTYAAVYGDRFFEIEYPDGERDHPPTPARGARISIVLRDRDLALPDDASYRYEAC